MFLLFAGASFRVTESSDCQSYIMVMPVLDITRRGRRKLCLELAGTDITKCNIIKKDSKYFYKGKWFPIWPTNRKQDIFNITEDDHDSFLKVGKVYIHHDHVTRWGFGLCQLIKTSLEILMMESKTQIFRVLPNCVGRAYENEHLFLWFVLLLTTE